MDLTPFTQSDTFDVVIHDPKTGKPSDIIITVYGSDTKEYRAAQAKVFKGKSTEEDGNLLLAAVTKDWVNVDYEDKKNIKCSPATVLKIYKAVPSVRKQVDLAVHNSVNFMQGKGLKH